MSNPCPIHGCTTPAKPGRLMCWTHWRQVPKILNHAVFETYRNLSSRNIGAVLAYREARDAAISAVNAKELGLEYDL